MLKLYNNLYIQTLTKQNYLKNKHIYNEKNRNYYKEKMYINAHMNITLYVKIPKYYKYSQ